MSATALCLTSWATTPAAPPVAPSLILQAAKLGDVPQLLAELDAVRALLQQGTRPGRIYGLSGGALAALAVALDLTLAGPSVGATHASPLQTPVIDEFVAFLRRAHSRELRSFALDPRYGVWTLRPLEKWLAGRLRHHLGADNPPLSRLAVPLYLAAMDRDGTFTLFGPPDEALQCPYGFVHVGPPRDAPILEATLAALSTLLSTAPVWVPAMPGTSDAGGWFRDCRPAIADSAAIVADLESAAPRPLLRTRPYAPIRPWKLNWITSSFIMHSQQERNQTLLAAYYLGLLQRHRALLTCRGKEGGNPTVGAYGDTPLRGSLPSPSAAPLIRHVDLPYIGSTEAATNMRQSVQNKEALLARFSTVLEGQLDGFPFDQPANIIYGAGGFSGILGGLVTTRAVAEGFARGGGEIRQIYGVSAGVLNGFFHAVQVAASQHPDLYRPAARSALTDLEAFIATLEQSKITRYNRNPKDIWRGWANLGPLEAFLGARLAAYTGAAHPERLTFDDIVLPLTIAVARGDGFTDFLGMTGPRVRQMRFGGQSWAVRPAPILRAIVAGWSMNTYILPTDLYEQSYRDGGGTFYDIGLFVAALDETLINQLNIHLDEPEGHSYGLPPRPDLVRLLFDTHNYSFPEERRRMRCLTDLLYEHERRRRALGDSTPDFRRTWDVP
jgi:hypothetical protein